MVRLKKEKAYPATRAQVPFPYEGTYLVEVLEGLTAVCSLPLWDATTFPEYSVVEKEADQKASWVSLASAKRMLVVGNGLVPFRHEHVAERVKPLPYKSSGFFFCSSGDQHLCRVV